MKYNETITKFYFIRWTLIKVQHNAKVYKKVSY